MSIETARSFFLWCSIINYGVLLVWVALATLGKRSLFKLTARLFQVTDSQIGLLNICGITLYKTGIILFNIVPCIALYIVR